MDIKDDIVQRLLYAKAHPEPGYGGNVLPAMDIYAKLTNPEERTSYLAAVKHMLRSPEEDVRDFAVSLCVGFFALGDVLRKRHGLS